jgi:hypothetical protein
MVASPDTPTHITPLENAEAAGTPEVSGTGAPAVAAEGETTAEGSNPTTPTDNQPQTPANDNQPFDPLPATGTE